MFVLIILCSFVFADDIGIGINDKPVVVEETVDVQQEVAYNLNYNLAFSIIVIIVLVVFILVYYFFKIKKTHPYERYIQKHLQKGYSKDQIYQKFMDSGHKKKHVDKFFKRV